MDGRYRPANCGADATMVRTACQAVRWVWVVGGQAHLRILKQQCFTPKIECFIHYVDLSSRIRSQTTCSPLSFIPGTLFFDREHQDGTEAILKSMALKNNCHGY
jgi:hypothetical protein